MNAKRAVLVSVVVVLLTVGSARSTQAQLMGGFNTFSTPGFTAMGGLNQFGSPAFANPGFGVGGYGAVSNLNSLQYGISPYGVYGGSPYSSGYNYGYQPYYNAYRSPYGYGTMVPSPYYYARPPVMVNQTNSLMGAIRSNTGRGNWRLRRR